MHGLVPWSKREIWALFKVENNHFLALIIVILWQVLMEQYSHYGSIIVFFCILMLALQSLIEYTIIVIMHRAILCLVCLFSHCTVCIVLYNMYQSFVFVAVLVQCQFQCFFFFLLLLKLRPLRMRSRSAPPPQTTFFT